jgi:hypothetical protein
MKNRVGTMVPSDELVSGWIGTLKKLQVDMAPYGVGLTPDERKHTLKFRPGGETIVHAIAASVRNHSLSLPGISADGMEGDLVLVQKMKPVRDAAQALFEFADDTILEGSSECWYAATAYYTALSRMVSSFPDIKAVVAEVASFMSTRRHRQTEPVQPEAAKAAT